MDSLNALCLRGQAYYWGEGVKKDYQRAMEAFEPAAAAGIGRAQRYLGVCYRFGHGTKKNVAAGKRWLERAVENKDESGAFELGCLYLFEKSYRNAKKARACFKQGAEWGHVCAMYNYGEMALEGDGGDQDVDEGVEWIRKAAQKGDRQAKLALGALYEDGIGMKQSNRNARVWYKKAADDGCKQAVKALRAMEIEEKVVRVGRPRKTGRG